MQFEQVEVAVVDMVRRLERLFVGQFELVELELADTQHCLQVDLVDRQFELVGKSVEVLDKLVVDSLLVD